MNVVWVFPFITFTQLFLIQAGLHPRICEIFYDQFQDGQEYLGQIQTLSNHDFNDFSQVNSVFDDSSLDNTGGCSLDIEI